MKFKDKVNKRITRLHAVVTLVAYLFFVLWLAGPRIILFRILFIEAWFVAVLLGTLI